MALALPLDGGLDWPAFPVAGGLILVRKVLAGGAAVLKDRACG
jgi:hypothetical protein